MGYHLNQFESIVFFMLVLKLGQRASYYIICKSRNECKTFLECTVQKYLCGAKYLGAGVWRTKLIRELSARHRPGSSGEETDLA